MGYAGHDERRARILDAAARVMTESGLDKVSVRAVAAAAGVATGSLRHYFPTQRDLHEALIARMLDDEIDDVGIDDVTAPAAERLERCVLQFLPPDAESLPLLDAWFGMYRAAMAPGAGASRQRLDIMTRRAQERIATWLRALAREGWTDPARAQVRALHVSALVSGLCLELMTPGSAMTLETARVIVADTVRSFEWKERS